MDLQEHKLDLVLWAAERKKVQKDGPLKSFAPKRITCSSLVPAESQLSGIWSVWVEYFCKHNTIGTMQQNFRDELYDSYKAS